MSIRRTVKNISRVQEVIRILMKHSFEDIVSRTGLNTFLTPQGRIRIRKSDPFIEELGVWVRIRLVIEELGPTFIKFAQVLSNRPDVLPNLLLREFEKLQNEVAPFSYKIAQSIVDEELGRPWSEVFMFFDKPCLGSASIGQVHRARLLDGTDVVIKVQRPNIKDKVISDLALLHQVVSLTAQYFENHGVLNPLEIVETFRESILKELDYTQEARNIEQFRLLYGDDTSLYIPKAHREFSTKKILVIEFVSGCKITDIQQLKRWDLSPQTIAERGVGIYLRQMFRHGIFHADPHPGNVLVRPNGQIVLIDFGMVGRLSRRQRFIFAGIILSMGQRDARAMATNLRRLASQHSIKSQRRFETDIEELIEDFVVVNVDAMGIAEFTGRLQQIIYKYKLQLPGSIFLLLRALAIIEGIGQVLHPKFDTMTYLRPFGEELIGEQFSASNLKNEFRHSMSQIVSLLYSSPIDLKNIIKQLRRGEFKTQTEVLGLEVFHKTANHVANKLVLAILIFGLAVGSSIALLAPKDAMYQLLGMPIVSTLGYASTIILGFALLYEMRRDTR
jgi:ubiquinone biosynthesis protein